MNLDSTPPSLDLTCSAKRAVEPAKPNSYSTTGPGPPLIWTAVVYDRRAFGAHRAPLQ
jgi:hypothetical protein